MSRLRRVLVLPADPPHPPPRVAPLDDLCAEITDALKSVNVQARYRHLALLPWSTPTSDNTVNWTLLDKPISEAERAQVWWPLSVNRLPQTEQLALSAALLRQVLDRLANLGQWPDKERSLLLRPLRDVPQPQRGVVQTDPRVG